MEEPAVPEAVQRGQQLSVSPGRWCEIWFRTSFRELVTPRAVTYMATVIGSFLNTEGGSGTFYIGLDQQGKVRGVSLNLDQKEKIRQVLDGRVEALQGHLDTLAAELREVRAEEARLKMQLHTV
jgi:hypothetical protein